MKISTLDLFILNSPRKVETQRTTTLNIEQLLGRQVQSSTDKAENMRSPSLLLFYHYFFTQHNYFFFFFFSSINSYLFSSTEMFLNNMLR